MSTYLLAVAWMWAIAAISPGPNFLFIAQIAASKSRSAAVAAVCGTGLATLIWGVCGVTGVHAVFLAAPWAYLALKIVGAAYLVCSGALMMVRSCKRRNMNSPGGTRQMSWRKAYTIGMATGLANPRSALSVASVFAVAMPREPTLSLAVGAIGIMVAVSIGWYFFVAYMFASEPVMRSYRQFGHWIDKLAGGMLVLLGLRLAIESK